MNCEFTPTTTPYLDTDATQIDTNKILSKGIELQFPFLKNISGPKALVLFYTKEDITMNLGSDIRKEDLYKTFKIGRGFFSLVVLSNAAAEDAHAFVRSVVHYRLANIKTIFHFDDLPSSPHNLFNYVNSFLIEIKEKKRYLL